MSGPPGARSPAPRQRTRMRTVFTETQSRELEQLFLRAHYPPADARAQLAACTGLSEETVRVWFKNRRARRKRQRSGSKRAASRSPPRGEGGPNGT
ncbi:unnamed protein product [Menidia menidia]|uniref:(Atlantic silverside) hypothetical protein n=1 Tax=Menidia menidia TaxID=238744 RepID=A0A8S4BLS0_9TELE|nr:unnamed protein product [Menidia menidia]